MLVTYYDKKHAHCDSDLHFADLLFCCREFDK